MEPFMAFRLADGLCYVLVCHRSVLLNMSLYMKKERIITTWLLAQVFGKTQGQQQTLK